MEKCNFCPHKCNVDRNISNNGFCKSYYNAYLSSVCKHTGEEPCLCGGKGICNVFFAHCNLQCVYCQNIGISDNNNDNFQIVNAEELSTKIIELLKTTENIVSFVSPSHFVPLIIETIDLIKAKGYSPRFVYNTNSYDDVESLKLLEGRIDIYLPDFKYSDEELAFRYSRIKNYPSVALAAIKEMYRQKGSRLVIDEKTGLAESGIIIRHLLLPGNLEQSKKVLETIAYEISTSLHISLMSQYFTVKHFVDNEELNRKVSEDEYNELIDYYDKLGFYNGWLQKFESSDCYKPKIINNEISF